MSYIISIFEVRFPPFRPSVSLELYEHAKLIDSDYQIPTAPSQPSDVSLSHDGVTLEWEKSAAGESNVMFYEVETFIVNGNESEFEKVTC